MKIDGRGLAGAMLVVLLFIIGLSGTILFVGHYQDIIQSRSLLDFFGELLLFVLSLVILFLAMGSGILIKRGKQKIIARILFSCFTIFVLFSAFLLFDPVSSPEFLAFFLPAMGMYFLFFFFLESLVYATIEDKNSQTAQTMFKGNVSNPNFVLLAVTISLYILSLFVAFNR